MSKLHLSRSSYALLLLATSAGLGYAQTGSLSLTNSPMHVGRTYQSAIPLSNGTVLMIGGEQADAQIEAFALPAGTFAQAGAMLTPRTHQTATFLSNGCPPAMTSGCILITGGIDQSGNTLSSAELYDPVTGTSQAIPGGINSPRSDHRATLLQNGTVLITGGVDSSGIALSSAEIFDPATGMFTLVGDMQHARVLHTATLLNNGQVLIAGGANYSQHQACSTVPYSNSCSTVTWTDGEPSAELYDPGSQQFIPSGSMQVGRWDHTATLLSGSGQVLILGGGQQYETHAYGPAVPYGVWTVNNSAEIYDPSAGQFYPAGSIATGRLGHTATLLPSGSILVAGGEYEQMLTGPYDFGLQTTSLNSTEIFNPSSGSSAPGPNLSTGRTHHTSTMLPNGAVLVTGGGVASADLYWPAGVPVTSGLDQVAEYPLSWGYAWNGYQGGPCNANWYTQGVTFPRDFNLEEIRIPNTNNGYGGKFYIYDDSTSTVYADSVDSNTSFGENVVSIFHFAGPLIKAGHTYYFDGDHVGPPGGDFLTGGYSYNCNPSLWDFYAQAAVPAAPSVQFSPSQLVFQSSNSTLSVTVTNTGGANLQFAVVPYLTGPNSSDFSIAAGTTCTNGAEISASQSCTVNVEYSPKTDSSESATLSFSDNASDSPQTVSLSGTLQAGGPQIAVISPNPIVGSSISQNVEIVGTGFVNGSVVNWADLTNGGTGTITPQVNSPNVLSATMISGDETATWQFQVTNPDGTASNCAAFPSSSGTTTLPCYSIQVLSPDLPHSYRNDYLFQNAPYCPVSTPDSSCLADTDDPYGFFYRECTSFVAWRINRDFETADPNAPSFFNAMGKGTWGAARHWNTNAAALGYVVDTSPEVGSIAQWVNGCGGNCSSGHVAYVEKVNSDGTIDISEYNYAGDDNKVSSEPGDHQFGIRTVSATSPKMVFIHLRRMLLGSDTLASGVWAFGNQPVGSPSSQTLTISNPQSAPIVIASVGIAGGKSSDFVESNSTCSSGIQPNGTCAITVTFTPSASGPRNSTLTVKGTAGTQILSLSGAGLAPLTVSQSVSFGNVALGDTIQKTLSVVNKTGADLSITNLASGSDEFAESNTCGTVLSYKSSCAITIAFSPAIIGARTSFLTISDSATNSPQTVALNGTGIAPVQISPLTVAFGTFAVGKSSASKSIQIKNNSAEPLSITGLSWGGTNPGDFQVTSSTCSVALAEGAKCSIGISFSPTATGMRQAVLELTDGAITNPQTVAVTGAGR